ncbi:MAG TPA: YihY family inner membrane protein [Aquabacterium sp.]|nr:YihY family inner membrane protein [Aquabacterium sp.]HQC95410.1 YihY family inner membrane protein [Aquabacterium sp.]
MISPVAALRRAPRFLGRLLAGLLGLLTRWPWFDTLRTLRQRLREDHLALTAGSLTFTTLISLVPLVTVMLAVFTAFPIFGRFQAALQQYFLQALVPDHIARPVLQALTQFAGKASKLGSVGLLLLVATALALMFTIDRTLNGIWRTRAPRPLAQRVLVYWTGLTLGPLLLGAGLSLTSYALSASGGLVKALPGGLALLIDLAEAGLLAAGVALLFRYVPNTHVRWRHAWAGAVFVAIGIEIAKRLLGWYIKAVPTYSVMYGAFAALPLLLLWLYLSWLIVLLGAVVAAYAPSLALHVLRLPDRPGERFALALSVLQALAESRQAGRPGIATEALAGALRVDPLQVEPVLDDLIALGWCGRLDEPGPQRHVLLVEPLQTLAQPLVDRLLLADAQRSAGFRQRAGLGRLTVADLLG